MAIKKGKGHNGPSTLLVGAISQSFAGFTQWRTLAGTLTNKIKKVEVNGFEKSDGWLEEHIFRACYRYKLL